MDLVRELLHEAQNYGPGGSEPPGSSSQRGSEQVVAPAV